MIADCGGVDAVERGGVIMNMKITGDGCEKNAHFIAACAEHDTLHRVPILACPKYLPAACIFDAVLCPFSMGGLSIVMK